MKTPDSPTGLSRRDFVKIGTSAAFLTSLGLPAQAGARHPGKRPNIVFYFSDEHRWSSLPFTEMPEVVAPNMTLLARQGMRFDNCCGTSPVCTPYRAILITGQWPHQSSCISNDTFIDGDVIGLTSPTIAQVFKKGGYHTGYVGKWHLKNETVFNAGFDYFKHWLYGDDHWKTPVRDVPSKEPFQTVEGYNATGMTDQAIDYVNEHADDEDPFFLMVSINPPHWRWDDSPKEFYDLYPKDKITFRPNVTDPEDKVGEKFENYRHYHGHISAVDHELGRMMQALEDAGIAEDTILIYTSDHGSSFGSNGLFNKANPFDESARVPFIVRWPGRIKANTIADHNLGTIDLFPTLCGLAGITPPDHCFGQDFTPVFLGRPGPDPESQLILINNFNRNYFHSRLIPGERGKVSPFRSVRTKRYTYAVDPLGGWILFDNLADPFQLNNLVDDPAYQELKVKLARELDNWLAKAEDPFIPEEWRSLPLPERIARQNEYYSLLNFQQQWKDYKAAALAPYLDKANPRQAAALEKLGDDLFDRDFIGLYLALDNELHGRRRGTDLPREEIEQRLAALEKDTQSQLEAAAQRILAA